jgi:uncharacterized protein with PQ loop repeat
MTLQRIVIRTKSVEFMPYTLSFFLTLSAITWLVYGVLVKDFYIAVSDLFLELMYTVQTCLFFTSLLYMFCCCCITHPAACMLSFVLLHNLDTESSISPLFFFPHLCADPKHSGFYLWGASDGALCNLQELQDSSAYGA